MVSMSQRMRKLQQRLLAIRLGSGSLVLPKEVKKIHMRFAPKMNQGHMGPRKFWRHELVRLKYHNPAVSMTVDRSAESFDPAIMSIHFQTEGSDAEKVETINMKNYRSSEILEALRSLTKASPVEPTPRDLEEQEKMLEQRAKSLQDSKLSLEVRDKIRRERQLLLQARGSMASANDA